MLNRSRAWREKGRQVADTRSYAHAWQQWGGSVITPSAIVAGLSALSGVEPRCLVCLRSGELVGVIAALGRFLALSRLVLRHYLKKEAFGLGNAEVILPFAHEARIPLRFSMQYVSQCHEPGISTLRQQKESIALAKAPEEYSKKFLYNQRRELRLFQEQGGIIRSILEFSPEEIAAHHTRLFALRRGFAPGTQQTLPQVLRVLRPFLNTQAAWEEARAADKPLRFSFGRVDRDYKMRCCRRGPAFQNIEYQGHDSYCCLLYTSEAETV